MAPYKIVLIRHGESIYNQENRFCGWHDADLSTQGVNEAKQAGELLKKEGYVFDVAYTSLLKRAIRTLNFVLEVLDANWIPVNKTYRLNERMYGSLQGLNKSETAAQHGEDQVKIWRRAYDIPPPPLTISDPRWPGNEAKYGSCKRVVIAAHGNSLRALIKFLDGIPDNDIVELNIPTGIPLVYELDANLKPIKHYYLADEATVAAAIGKVANQGKK